MLHLLCEPKIEFKNLAGGKALANDHRKIAEYIFLPVGGYFSIYFICSPTGNPPGPASELLYKQNSTKMNRTIDCFMSTWFARGFSLKVYDELNILKRENNLSLLFFLHNLLFDYNCQNSLHSFHLPENTRIVSNCITFRMNAFSVFFVLSTTCFDQ